MFGGPCHPFWLSPFKTVCRRQQVCTAAPFYSWLSTEAYLISNNPQIPAGAGEQWVLLFVPFGFMENRETKLCSVCSWSSRPVVYSHIKARKTGDGGCEATFTFSTYHLPPPLSSPHCGSNRWQFDVMRGKTACHTSSFPSSSLLPSSSFSIFVFFFFSFLLPSSLLPPSSSLSCYLLLLHVTDHKPSLKLHTSTYCGVSMLHFVGQWKQFGFTSSAENEAIPNM